MEEEEKEEEEEAGPPSPAPGWLAGGTGILAINLILLLTISFLHTDVFFIRFILTNNFENPQYSSTFFSTIFLSKSTCYT